METRDEGNTKLNTIGLFALIYRWRKHLLVVAVATAVLSALASFLIRPQYKAVTSLFAVRSMTTAKFLTDGPENMTEDYMDIGDEDDIEKLLQILHSTELQDLVVEKFDLYRHWKINTSDPNKDTWMTLKFQEMVNFRRTDMKSVRVEVYDYSPDTAAAIANAIASFADTVKTRYTRRIALEALAIVKTEYDKTLSYMKTLEDSMQKIRAKGVLEYNYQVQALTKSLGKALAEGKQAGVDKIDERLKAFATYGGPFFHLTNEVLLQMERQVFLKSRLDAAYMNASKTFPSNLQVQKAKRPDKKARPIRWIVILVSTASALLCSVLLILLLERFNEFKKKIKEISK